MNQQLYSRLESENQVSMCSFPWQRNKSFLLAIFIGVACSIKTGIGLQSRRFIACRRDGRALGSCSRSGTRYRTLRDEDNLENEFATDLSSAPVDHSTSRMRRGLLLSTSGGFLGLTGIYGTNPAQAVSVFEKKGLYVLNTRDAVSEASLSNEQVQVFPKLSSEYALLRVLPVKNTIFRTLEQNLESLSVLRYRRGTSNAIIDKAWARADQSVDTALTILVNKRNQLEPVFNPDDSAEVAKLKLERGQKLLGDLNQDFETLKEAISRRVGSDTCLFVFFILLLLIMSLTFASPLRNIISEYNLRFSKTKKWVGHTWVPGRAACEAISVQSTIQRQVLILATFVGACSGKYDLIESSGWWLLPTFLREHSHN